MTTTVQVTSEINIQMDEVLDGVSKLDTPELEQFFNQVSILLAQRKAPYLSPQEATLLQKINQGLPEALLQRYGELTEKLRAETISVLEQQALHQLIDQIELADAERLQYLIELAQLRGVSLDELMAQLGISTPSPHG
jgi:hypothetical protein